MFEVRCIVGDKKLADALRALKGHTIEPPVAIAISEDKDPEVARPAVAAQVKPQLTPTARVERRKAKRKRNLRSGGAIGIARSIISVPGKTRVSAKELKQATMAAGYSHNSYSHAIKLMIEDGIVESTDEKGVYKIVQQTHAQHPLEADPMTNEGFLPIGG